MREACKAERGARRDLVSVSFLARTRYISGRQLPARGRHVNKPHACLPAFTWLPRRPCNVTPSDRHADGFTVLLRPWRYRFHFTRRPERTPSPSKDWPQVPRTPRPDHSSPLSAAGWKACKPHLVPCLGGVGEMMKSVHRNDHQLQISPCIQ